MHKEVRVYPDLSRKLATIEYAEAFGNVAKACCTFNVPRASHYRRKKVYDVEGRAGLRWKQPIARKHPNRIRKDVIDKILHLRTTSDCLKPSGPRYRCRTINRRSRNRLRCRARHRRAQR